MRTKHFTKTIGGVVFMASEAPSGGWNITARLMRGVLDPKDEPAPLESRSADNEFDAGRQFQAMIDQHALTRADVLRDQHLGGDRTVAP